jgi:hypothetical protein
MFAFSGAVTLQFVNAISPPREQEDCALEWLDGEIATENNQNSTAD